MNPFEFLKWLCKDRRINHVFDNLRNFLICGNLAYLSLHLLRLAGFGIWGSIERGISGAMLSVALVLMLVNMVDGYHRIRQTFGRRLSLIVTGFYFLAALYVVLAMTTYKMHIKPEQPAASPNIPFSIFE